MARPLSITEEIEKLEKERDILYSKLGTLTKKEAERLVEIGRLLEVYSKSMSSTIEDIIMSHRTGEKTWRETRRRIKDEKKRARDIMLSLVAENKDKDFERWAKEKQDEYLTAKRLFESAEDAEDRYSVTSKIDSISKGLGTIYDKIKALNDPWAKASQAAADYAKSVGMSSDAMDVLLDKTLKNVTGANIAGKYNVSTEELLKMQSDYIRGVGRSVRVSGGDQEYMAAMHSVMQGREGELIQQFENFGVNITSVGERVGKMWSDASKAGISFEKYSDNVAKNMRIAQNYTFRNGLKGLESMAMKATAIRMDMQQVANLAEKVSTVEGAIDVGAKLQVLGGPFAQMADPLGMLNEGLNDMEGLTDRIARMIGGLGTFNRQTGEVEVSAFNKRRIKAAAEAMGMDSGAIMESVNAQARKGEIDRQMSASVHAAGLKEEVKELIRNIGTFQNGKAGVSINGEFKTLDEISNKDYEALMTESRSESDNIKDIAQNVRGLLEIRSGVGKARDSWMARILKYLGGFEVVMATLAATTVGIQFILAGMKIFDTIGGVGRTGKAGRNAMEWLQRKRTGTADGAGQAMAKGGDIARGKAATEQEIRKIRRARQPRDDNGKWRKATPEEQMRIEREIDMMRKGTSETAAVRGRGMKGRIGGMFGKAKETVGRAAGKVSGMTGKVAGKSILKNIGKSALKYGGKILKVGNIGGLVAGIGGDLLTNHLVSAGKVKEGTAGYTALMAGNGALQGAATGAALGSIIPGVGTVIGGIAGALAGGINGWLKNRPVKAKEKSGVNTTKRDTTSSGKQKWGRVLRNAGKTYATAGGGLLIAGTAGLVTAVKRRSAVKQQEKSGEELRISPTADRGIETSWKKVAPTRMTPALQNQQPAVPSRFDLTLNGTLKLTGDKGQSVDIISELRRNPQVLRSLSDMIAKEVSHINRGTNIVQKG